MTPTLQVNAAEFNRVLQMVAAESSRTYPQVCNGQGLALASRSIKLTEKADANKIASELGQIASQRTVSKKSGRVSTKRIYDDKLTVATRILNARRRKEGQPMLSGDELMRAARRMIGARLRAVAFIRSGWIYAVRTLSKMVGYADRRGAAVGGSATRMTGQPKGYAKPAIRTLNDFVTCEIGNTALLQEKRSPMPVAQKGLNLAFQMSTKDMLEHLASKTRTVFKKYGGQ